MVPVGLDETPVTASEPMAPTRMTPRRSKMEARTCITVIDKNFFRLVDVKIPSVDFKVTIWLVIEFTMIDIILRGRGELKI